MPPPVANATPWRTHKRLTQTLPLPALTCCPSSLLHSEFEFKFQKKKQLHQFQAELFKLPYAFSPARPTITGQSAQAVAMGDQVTVDYEGAVDGAVLVAPGAVTHQVRGWGVGAALRWERDCTRARRDLLYIYLAACCLFAESFPPSADDGGR